MWVHPSKSFLFEFRLLHLKKVQRMWETVGTFIGCMHQSVHGRCIILTVLEIHDVCVFFFLHRMHPDSIRCTSLASGIAPAGTTADAPAVGANSPSAIHAYALTCQAAYWKPEQIPAVGTRKGRAISQPRLMRHRDVSHGCQCSEHGVWHDSCELKGRLFRLCILLPIHGCCIIQLSHFPP